MSELPLKFAKDKLIDSDTAVKLREIFLAVLSSLYPPFSVLTPIIQDKLAEKLTKNRQEFLDRIMDMGFLVTTEMIQDTAFLTETIKTLEVIDRLATNDKIHFIANLYCNSFNGEYDYNYDEYEELLRSLSQLSTREIRLLIDFWRISQNTPTLNEGSSHNPSWDKFVAHCQEKGINKERLIAIMASLSRSGYCKEITGAFFDYTGGNFYTTPLLDDLIAKILNKNEKFI